MNPSEKEEPKPRCAEPIGSEVFDIRPHGPRDWTEDYKDEDNGCYDHRCATCEEVFSGHKHRTPMCKVCATGERKRWDALTPEQQAIENAEIDRKIREYFANQNNTVRNGEDGSPTQ